MEISDDKYDRLLAYIETGATKDLAPEMINYVELLDLIRGMYMRFETRDAIINFLTKPPYNYSRYLAVKYFSDAVNFFYLDSEIKKQAWRNAYADKLDRAAELVFRTATCPKDIDFYKNILYAAREFRQLNVPEVADIPEDFFKKPYKVYVLDPEKVGAKRANRNLLAKHIDSLDIPETEKDRVKADAGITDVKFLEMEEYDEDRQDD